MGGMASQNMDQSVLDIVDRMLRFRRSRSDSTDRFLSLRHDEHLLPKFRDQLEAVLESYGKFNPITYTTQSVRDQGVDIVIRLDHKDSGVTSLIGFQIKAVSDLLEKDYMRTLKAQHFESRQIQGLEFYYIVLCVDERGNRQRLRMIETEFKNAEKTRIIEPSYADMFLSLNQQRIDGYIKRTLAGGDVVLKKALDVVRYPSRITAAVVVYLAIQQYLASAAPIKIRELLDSVPLQELHKRLLQEPQLRNNDESESVAEFLGNFEDNILESVESLRDDIVTLEGDVVSVDFQRVAPLLALGTEALVRFEYEPSEIAEYLFDLLGLSG
jgi:hypothetical protein